MNDGNGDQGDIGDYGGGTYGSGYEAGYAGDVGPSGGYGGGEGFGLFGPGFVGETNAPNLKEIYDKDLIAVETSRISAEIELERSKKEFLQLQAGVGDPKRISPFIAPSQMVSGGIGTLVLIGAGIYFLMKSNLFK